MHKLLRMLCSSTILALIVASCSATIRAEEPHTAFALDSRIVRKYAEGSDWRSVGRAGQSIIRNIDAAGLAAMRGDSSTNISLLGAFQSALQGPSLPFVENDRLSYFVGFVEGRVRVAPPTFWTCALESYHFRNVKGHQMRCRGVRSNDDDIGANGQLVTIGERTIRVQPGVEVSFTSSQVVLRKGNATLALSTEGVVEMVKKRDRLSVEVIDSTMLLAAHDGLGRPYPAMLYECKTGKLLWQTEIWASGGDDVLVRNGRQEHGLRIMVTGNAIWLFGASHGCYIEGLDVDTGNSRCRFSSVLWHIPATTVRNDEE